MHDSPLVNKLSKRVRERSTNRDENFARKCRRGVINCPLDTPPQYSGKSDRRLIQRVLPRSRKKEKILLIDRGTVEQNSCGSHENLLNICTTNNSDQHLNQAQTRQLPKSFQMANGKSKPPSCPTKKDAPSSVSFVQCKGPVRFSASTALPVLA